MDLGLPIRSVIPSLDSAVYRVLVRAGSPLTAPQVWRLAGEGSEEGVRIVLNRMVSEGLASSTRAGRAYLYEINRDHLAYGPIASLVGLMEVLLTRIRGQLEPIAAHVAGAYLFGSVARGEADRDSDVDVLVVTHTSLSEDEKTAVDRCANDLTRKILQWTGNPGVVILSELAELAGLVVDGRPIIDELRADARPIVGGRIDDLLTTASERP